MKSKPMTFWKPLKWTGIILIICYLTLGEGLKDITIGRFDRKAQAVFSEVSGVTEVRIYLLSGSEGQKTNDLFPIRPYDQLAPVYGEVRLTDNQAVEFLKKWRWQSVSRAHYALCHEPAYGFRLYRGSKLAIETSICWKCSNFYFPMWPLGTPLYGFAADTKEAKDLLNFCDQLMPYARPD